MKESLRENYQVTVIGGLIVTAIVAISTLIITKYSTTQQENKISLDTKSKDTIANEVGSNKTKNFTLESKGGYSGSK